MLFYSRISELEGIDANHTCSVTYKECNVCHFYLFKDRNFLYQSLVFNGYHGVSLRAISLTYFKITSVKDKTYRIVNNLLYGESFCWLE